MTNKHEQMALAAIETETDVDKLLQLIKNARGKSMVVEKAAFEKLVQLQNTHQLGTVESACWQMVHSIETLRKINRRKASPMKRMRPKIEKDGEIGALAYCVAKGTQGFEEIMSYGLPQFTAEWMVLKYPQHFDDATRSKARDRLALRGVEFH